MMRRRNHRIGRRRRRIVLNVDVAPRRRAAGAGDGLRRRVGIPAAAAALALLAAVVLPGSPRGFMRPTGFTLRWIEVRNADLLGREEIVSLAGLKVGDDLLAADIRSIRERLRSHPDIRDAVVRRRIPGTVSIRVVERVPVAAVCRPEGGQPAGADRRRAVVDEEGIVLSAAKERAHRSLPVLLGLADDALRPGERLASPGARRALEVVRAYRESDLPRQIELVGVDVSDPSNCVLRSRSIAEIRLGGERLPERLRLLSYILAQRSSRGLAGPASYLDLRWRDVAEMPLGGGPPSG
ncbi:MAG: FtsQ-type POTRA domain-containing protein [bacterium]|nr:FtsQ-type POTRA domain-containing protein [bacterium]